MKKIFQELHKLRRSFWPEGIRSHFSLVAYSSGKIFNVYSTEGIGQVIMSSQSSEIPFSTNTLKIKLL